VHSISLRKQVASKRFFFRLLAGCSWCFFSDFKLSSVAISHKNHVKKLSAFNVENKNHSK
jgi:hypothetical protein